MPTHAPQGAAPAPAKKGPLPWILGGCGCLFVLALLVAIGGFLFYKMVAKAQKGIEEIASYQAPLGSGPVESGPVESGPVGSAPVGSAPVGSAPVENTIIPEPPAPASSQAVPLSPLTPVPAPPGWKTYVNTVDALPEDMKPKFVAFTFNYPEKFAAIPDDDVNFIKVEESLTDPVQGSFTLENFAVGNMIANPESFPGMDQELIYPMLLEQLGAQFAQSLPNYQKISEAPEEVSGLRGRSTLFQAEFKGTDKGDITFYGKTLLVRQPGKERGVVIIMMATSLDPEIKSAADVGVKGDLGAILKSFRLTGEESAPLESAPLKSAPLKSVPLENIVIPEPPAAASSQVVPPSPLNVDLSTPVATTKSFFAAMKAGDQATAESTSGADMREMATERGIQSLFGSLQEEWGEIVSIVDEPIFSKGSADVCGVPVNFNSQKKGLEVEKVNLVRAGGQWLITGY